LPNKNVPIFYLILIETSSRGKKFISGRDEK